MIWVCKFSSHIFRGQKNNIWTILTNYSINWRKFINIFLNESEIRNVEWEARFGLRVKQKCVTYFAWKFLLSIAKLKIFISLIPFWIKVIKSQMTLQYTLQGWGFLFCFNNIHFVETLWVPVHLPNIDSAGAGWKVQTNSWTSSCWFYRLSGVQRLRTACKLSPE